MLLSGISMDAVDIFNESVAWLEMNILHTGGHSAYRRQLECVQNMISAEGTGDDNL